MFQLSKVSLTSIRKCSETVKWNVVLTIFNGVFVQNYDDSLSNFHGRWQWTVTSLIYGKLTWFFSSSLSESYVPASPTLWVLAIKVYLLLPQHPRFINSGTNFEFVEYLSAFQLCTYGFVGQLSSFCSHCSNARLSTTNCWLISCGNQQLKWKFRDLNGF